MGIYHPRAKEALRADGALRQRLADLIAADPHDAGAIAKLSRVYVRGERPFKALKGINSKTVKGSQDVKVHRLACETLLDIGAFDAARRRALKGLAIESNSQLSALLQRAIRLCGEDEALGVDAALKNIYLTAFQKLSESQPASAAELFEQVVAQAPRYYPAWIGLRGALCVQGERAALDSFAGRWIAASPESEPVVRIVMARPLDEGLLFNRRTALPLLALRETMQEVRSLEALDANPSAFLLLDPGGEPVTLDPVISRWPDRRDRIVLTYNTPEVFIAAIDNAVVVGRGAVIDSAGVLVRELHGPNQKKHGLLGDDRGAVAFDPGTMPSLLSGVKVHDTPALLMAGAGDLSFGDWLLIYLPRLKIARASGLKCPVVINAQAPPAFIELLRQLGLRDDEIIIHDPHSISLFRKLYVPSWPLRDYLAPMKGLFDIHRQLALPSTNGPGRRLYLSREKVPQRRLVNEAEVREALEARGFEVIHAQDLSLHKMRELMADAETVVAPYGSALLNLAMAGRQPKVLVLASSIKFGFINQAALWLGSLGLQLAYVKGKPVGAVAFDGKDATWSVSLAEVQQALTIVLG